VIGARRGRRDDRGVVLVLVALLMVALLAVAALVIDIGLARASKRGDQSTADIAALAAGFFLSGRGTSDSRVSAKLGCNAAIKSAMTNVTGFTPTLTGTECNGFPDRVDPDAGSGGCSSAIAPVTVTSGIYTMTVRYPVPNSELSDSRFSGTGINDGTNQCMRMAVSFSRRNPTGFARIVGMNNVTTAARAVVRASTSAHGLNFAALLLLERVGCATLQTSGGGTNGSGVVIQASSNTNPAIIESDTAGIVGASAPVVCGNNDNGNAPNWAVYGNALPAAGGGGPSIVICPVAGDPRCGTNTTGTGLLALYSVSVPNGRLAAVVPTGVSTSPIALDLPASRISVDNKYNLATTSGGHEQLTSFHSTAHALATSTWGAGLQSQGYVHVTQCNNFSGSVAGTKIFVDCTGGFSPGQLIFPDATTVVMTGKLAIGGGSVLSMPSVRTLAIRGCPADSNTGGTGCSGGGYAGIDIAANGALLVNTGETTLPASPFTGGTACASRTAATTSNWSEIATFGGPIKVAGFLRLCQTFLYNAHNSTTYSKQSVFTTGGAYPAIALCSTELPCPKSSVDSGDDAPFVTFSGGSGAADWSAPNQLSRPTVQADFATYPFEDLAFWTEGTSASDIKGQGSNSTQGVYFLPNASALFTGQATQAQPLNAQFVVRALNVSSQGTLILRPNPDDAVATPSPGNVSLIR